MIHKYTQIIVGDIERDILIGLFGKSTAVLIYDVYALSVPYEVPKPLTKTVHMLADLKVQLFSHKGTVIAVDICESAVF